MSKRSICLINDSFPPEIDGVANAVVNYASILTRTGQNAAVVTPSWPGADDSVWSFPVIRYPSLGTAKAVGYRAGFPFSPETLHTLGHMDIDLIHCHCPITSAMLARMLRERIHVPVVFTYHTKFDIDIAKAIRSRLLQDESKRILADNISACDEVWTVSRGAGENLRALGYRGDYYVMPNGVDLPRGRVSRQETENISRGFDLPADIPVYLFVGRIMWYKGLRIILDALSAARSQGQDFRMIFIGGGTDREEVIAYTKQLGLDDWVFFIPPQSDRNILRAWYCRADLFLFPSTFDTNGLVVREAAACGLASVLVRGSCAAEDITDGSTGFLTDENAESLAAVLTALAKVPEAVRRVGANACERLYISWEESVHRASERYEVVLDNYRRGLYPPRKQLSDDAFHALSALMEIYDRNRNLRQELHSSLQRDQKELLEHWNNMRDRFI